MIRFLRSYREKTAAARRAQEQLRQVTEKWQRRSVEHRGSCDVSQRFSTVHSAMREALSAKKQARASAQRLLTSVAHIKPFEVK